MLSLGDIFRVVKSYCDEPIDRVEVAYWWLVHHHRGQGCRYYQYLCALPFSPGLSSEIIAVDHIAYDALCAEEG